MRQVEEEEAEQIGDSEKEGENKEADECVKDEQHAE